MLSTTTKEAGKVTKELAKDDVKNGLRNAAYEAGATANDAVESISEYAHKAGRNVRRYIDQAGDELSHVSDKVASEIRTNPVRSGLVILGVGFLVGLLARR